MCKTKKMMGLAWLLWLACCIGLVICLVMTTTASAEGADAARKYTFELSTQYPSMVVKAGDSLTFDLDIDNQSGQSQDVKLTIEDIPEGWTGTFSASSKQIDIVHVKDEATNTSVDFTLDIPMDAPDGTYTVKLKAAGEKASDEMTLALRVDAEEIGDSSFEVEYPSQEGDSDTSFTFDATLINNMLSEQSYSFSANAPSGWQVSFLPAGESTKVAALNVEARSTQGVDIEVTPPANVDAGTYDITCTATSAQEKLTVGLSVTITGTYEIELSTPSGRLSMDAYANKGSEIQITLTNTGNTDLTNVNLTSSAPSGWNVQFKTETIELIEAGATVETTATITPGDDAMSGDYVTQLKVKSGTASDEIELRVSVKTETIWGFTGILILLLLAAGLAAIMRRYGRR